MDNVVVTVDAVDDGVTVVAVVGVELVTIEFFEMLLLVRLGLLLDEMPECSCSNSFNV